MKGAVLLGVILLAACAPAATSPRAGRIVNVATGQEGRLLLSGATVSGRSAARIELGADVFVGEYNVLGSSAPVSFGVGVGATTSSGAASALFNFGPSGVPNGTRSGTILVRSDSGLVLSCQISVDAESRGNGTCADGRGGSYALQF